MPGLKDIAIGRSNLLMISPKDLREDPDNIRQDYGDLDSLAASIASKGILHPIRVRLSDDGSSATVVDGHRRFRAVQSLGALVLSVPCICETRGSNSESRIADMIASNGDQKPLTPLEQAEAFKKLIGFGWTEAKIAEQIGKSVSHVRQRIDLLSAPEDVRQAVMDGVIAVSTAKVLSSASMDERAEVIAGPREKKKKTAGQIQDDLGRERPVFRVKILETWLNSAVEKRDADPDVDKRYMDGVSFALRCVLGRQDWSV